MSNFYKTIVLIGLFFGAGFQSGYAQGIGLAGQQNINQGLIRVAELGQLADTLNLWGDVRNAGKYLVPRRTNLTDLISYARGPVGLTEDQALSTKTKLEIYISRYNTELNKFQNQSFEIKTNEPLPDAMRNFPLRNGDVITVKASRKASFRDYFGIIAPVLTLGLTAFIAYDRVSR
jgi:hypothetical protein